MFIRKFFNRRNKEQEKVVSCQLTEIYEFTRQKIDKLLAKDEETSKDINGKCPNCGCENVVHKFANVSGNGYVSGEMFIGTGYVSGSSEVITKKVNHCNDCGNQWKLYNGQTFSSHKIIADDLFQITSYIKDPNRWSFQQGIYLRYSKYSAETIYELVKRCEHWSFHTVTKTLTLRILRKHFKSVFDGRK